MPCMAATTDSEFAELQSVSAKSAACTASCRVLLKSPFPNHTLVATMPPLTTALFVAGYSIPQRSSTARKIYSAVWPASAIVMTMFRH